MSLKSDDLIADEVNKLRQENTRLRMALKDHEAHARPYRMMNKLKEACKWWNQWGKAHPWKAVLFTFFFTTTTGLMAAVNQQGFRLFLGLFVFGLVALFSVVWRDMKKLTKALPFLVALSLISPTKSAEPPSAGWVGAGIVVICVGGYCGYKLHKFCQRKFPKDSASTNSFTLSGDDEMGASWNYGLLGSCDPTLPPNAIASVETEVTVFTIDINAELDGDMITRTRASFGERFTVSWTDYQREVAQHGIVVTGNADNSQYFSRNRIPCASGEVPISFDELTQTVEIGHGGRVVEVERSRDLVNWSKFLRTKTNRNVRIEDATTSTSMFYRVNVSEQ